MPDEDNALVALEDLRASIDNIDAAMIYMLAERFRCTQRVGALKAAHHLPPGDPARETFQIERLRQLADTAHLIQIRGKIPRLRNPGGHSPSRSVSTNILTTATQ